MNMLSESLSESPCVIDTLAAISAAQLGHAVLFAVVAAALVLTVLVWLAGKPNGDG